MYSLVPDAAAAAASGSSGRRSGSGAGAAPLAPLSPPSAAAPPPSGAARMRILAFEEVAAAKELQYLAWNPYIRRHYRAGATLREALLSVFALHNETVNVWLHLVGLLLSWAQRAPRRSRRRCCRPPSRSRQPLSTSSRRGHASRARRRPTSSCAWARSSCRSS